MSADLAQAGDAVAGAFLTQLQVPAHDIATIMTRRQAGMSYVLDLPQIDRETVTGLLLA